MEIILEKWKIILYACSPLLSLTPIKISAPSQFIPPPISRWRDLLKVRVSFGGLMSSEVARGDLTVTHVRRSCREGTDCWSRPRQEGVGGGVLMMGGGMGAQAPNKSR